MAVNQYVKRSPANPTTRAHWLAAGTLCRHEKHSQEPPKVEALTARARSQSIADTRRRLRIILSGSS